LGDYYFFARTEKHTFIFPGGEGRGRAFPFFTDREKAEAFGAAVGLGNENIRQVSADRLLRILVGLNKEAGVGGYMVDPLS
jgi:hypothetical protein